MTYKQMLLLGLGGAAISFLGMEIAIGLAHFVAYILIELLPF